MTRNASTGVVHVIRTQSYYYDRAEKITFNTFALPTFVLLLALTHVEKSTFFHPFGCHSQGCSCLVRIEW